MKARVAVPLALTTALVIGAGRQLVLGGDAMRASDDALARGDLPAAMAEARAAAEATLPASPRPAEGLARLGDIEREAHARGDGTTELAARRAASAAKRETRAILSDPASTEVSVAPSMWETMLLGLTPILAAFVLLRARREDRRGSSHV